MPGQSQGSERSWHIRLSGYEARRPPPSGLGMNRKRDCTSLRVRRGTHRESAAAGSPPHAPKRRGISAIQMRGPFPQLLPVLELRRMEQRAVPFGFHINIEATEIKIALI